MPSQPLSAKKTRAAVRDLALNNDEIVKVLQQQERAINTLNASVNVLTAIAKRPLLGRLRWLAVGK